jgi:hypothetical protein
VVGGAGGVGEGSVVGGAGGVLGGAVDGGVVLGIVVGVDPGDPVGGVPTFGRVTPAGGDFLPPGFFLRAGLW